MPIYEYLCRSCRAPFEALVQSGSTPECPACRSRDLARQLSVFAVGRGGGRAPAPAAGPCGTCGDPRGPGSCALDAG